MVQVDLEKTAHPFHPIEIVLLDYAANDLRVFQLLSMFATCCLVVLVTTRYVVVLIRPNIPTSDLTTVLWFGLSGCIHTFFEGYFVWHCKEIAGMQTFFAQLWKEYALADSRYLTQDALVLSAEITTVFLWGPLCFVVAGLAIRQSPLRHPMQIIVSMGHLYGVILYYATSIIDYHTHNLTYSRPEFRYFWGYYFSMNFIWILVPGYLIYKSSVATYQAFQAAQLTANTRSSGQYSKEFKPQAIGEACGESLAPTPKEAKRENRGESSGS